MSPLLPPRSVTVDGAHAHKGGTSAQEVQSHEIDGRVCSSMLPSANQNQLVLSFLLITFICGKFCFLSYLRSTSLSKELGSVLLLLIYSLRST